MTLEVNISYSATFDNIPTQSEITAWACASYLSTQPSSVAIRIVDEAESVALNSQYKSKNYATNVLSFAMEIPEEIDENLLGDLIICAPVILDEAKQQGKPAQAHWAHMVVHGMLHLQGYDHENEEDAEEMENLEKTILQNLSFPDPYKPIY